MTDQSDRKRLEAEVHQTDLKESQLNEDFIDSLKQYGPWVLVAVLGVVAVRLWMVRQDQDALVKRDTAWVELLTTTEPASLEDVAIAWPDVDGVSNLARLRAGELLLQSLSSTDMIEVERTEAINQANAAFSQVLAADDGTRANTVVAVSAMNGMAALAEAQGDADGAREWYGKSEARATGWLEPLAAQARARAASADVASAPTERPTSAPLTLPDSGALPAPPTIVDPADTNPLGLPVSGDGASGDADQTP